MGCAKFGQGLDKVWRGLSEFRQHFGKFGWGLLSLDQVWMSLNQFGQGLKEFRWDLEKVE